MTAQIAANQSCGDSFHANVTINAVAAHVCTQAAGRRYGASRNVQKREMA